MTSGEAARWRPQKSAHYRRLARPVLVAVAVTTGCLDEPPEYEAVERIEPLIISNSIDPDPNKLVVLEPGQDSLDIALRFRSEDLGQRVLGFTFLDLGSGPSINSIGGAIEEPPGTFDQMRSISPHRVTDLDVPGCHTLTLKLMHADNVSSSGRILEESRASSVVWWLLIKSDSEQDFMLSECPRGGQLP